MVQRERDSFERSLESYPLLNKPERERDLIPMPSAHLSCLLLPLRGQESRQKQVEQERERGQSRGKGVSPAYCRFLAVSGPRRGGSPAKGAFRIAISGNRGVQGVGEAQFVNGRLQVQQVTNGRFHHLKLSLWQPSEFAKKGVLIDAREPLDVHRGMFGKPARLANVHFPTQSPLLGCERNDDDQRTGIPRLRKSKNQHRALFCDESEINHPYLARNGINTHRMRPPTVSPAGRLSEGALEKS